MSQTLKRGVYRGKIFMGYQHRRHRNTTIDMLLEMVPTTTLRSCRKHHREIVFVRTINFLITDNFVRLLSRLKKTGRRRGVPTPG
jgi:hypothetical protein